MREVIRCGCVLSAAKAAGRGQALGLGVELSAAEPTTRSFREAFSTCPEPAYSKLFKLAERAGPEFIQGQPDRVRLCCL